MNLFTFSDKNADSQILSLDSCTDLLCGHSGINMSIQMHTHHPAARGQKKFQFLKLRLLHKEKSNKMQQCIKSLLFHIYMKLSMFRATHRPSSGA
jgi:hypothetical protein